VPAVSPPEHAATPGQVALPNPDFVRLDRIKFFLPDRTESLKTHSVFDLPALLSQDHPARQGDPASEHPDRDPIR
jgi:hypothetical protein